MSFTSDGDWLMTGSFDGTAKIWDTRSGQCVATLEEHTKELSNAVFEFSGEYVATSSLD